MESVRALAPSSAPATTRVSNEQQWQSAIDIAVAKFREHFPGATVTNAKLHNYNGRYGATRSIWTPNFRVEGELPDGRACMIEGLTTAVTLGRPLDDTRVATFVDHVAPRANSGAGVGSVS